LELGSINTGALYSRATAVFVAVALAVGLSLTGVFVPVADGVPVAVSVPVAALALVGTLVSVGAGVAVGGSGVGLGCSVAAGREAGAEVGVGVRAVWKRSQPKSPTARTIISNHRLMSSASNSTFLC
jgi:hypothetical protein